MEIKQAIHEVVNGNNLSRSAMYSVMQTIMQGEATDAQIAGLLVALRLKGESVDEITAAAQLMRKLSVGIEVDEIHLVDTCGTGGDGAGTFNISTTAAFVVAACGGKVAKHGNRSVSSKSGSADVLEAAGVNTTLTSEQVASCIQSVGIGFMFAPLYHTAMKHAINVRRELGTRTLFNMLGPLTNPAQTPNQLIGVFHHDWLQPLAEALRQLGSRHVLLVHADDGMDEISVAGNTQFVELKDGQIKHDILAPTDFGIACQDIATLRVNNVDESLAMLQAVLNNTVGAAKDIVCLNAGAAVYVAGIADSIKQGVDKAKAAIESGSAKQKLDQLIGHSQSFST